MDAVGLADGEQPIERGPGRNFGHELALVVGLELDLAMRGQVGHVRGLDVRAHGAPVGVNDGHPPLLQKGGSTSCPKTTEN
jgi:hypothetical protein